MGAECRSPGVGISYRVQNTFECLGRLVARHPLLFFLLPLLTTIMSTIGLARFREENRIWYLYSPSTAPSHREHAIASEFFNDRGGKFWLEVPITAKDMASLLRPQYLEAVESLSEYLQNNLTVPCSLSSTGWCSFADLCSGACNENQVVSIFRLLYRNESQRLHPNFRLTYPTMHLYNDEYFVGEHFSGVRIDERTNRISSIKLIVLYYRTDKRNSMIADALQRWETAMLDFVKQLDHPLLNATCSSDGLISQEVRRSGMAPIPYFSLTVIVVFLFIFITTHDWHDDHYCYRDSAIIAFVGTLSPLIAVVTTFNLLFLLGLPFNSITLVMPFLVIGVGCDDVFIIVHAWRRTAKNLSMEQRIGETMREAGPSITITSLTNMLSFAVGAFSSTPAIALFCLFSAVAVTIDFVYQITFFTSVIVYEGHRLRRREQNLLTKKDERQLKKNPRRKEEESEGIVSSYCSLLNKYQTRLGLLMVLIIYWTLSILGCQTMQIKMDSSDLVLADSPIHSIAWLYEKYLWKMGTQVFVFVNAPPDLSNKMSQWQVLELVNRFETLDTSMGHNSTSIWLRSFLKQEAFAIGAERKSFLMALDHWLNDTENGGPRWRDMLRLSRDSNGTLIGVEKIMFATASMLISRPGERVSWTARAKLQNQWRHIANMYRHLNVSVFQSYSFYVDQLEAIQSTTMGTVIAALITMAIACLLLIPSIASVFSSTAAMISINVGVFGLLSLWHVNLDPITMCTTLMSIGFSVDFTAHISYHYYLSPVQWSPEVRLADALRHIGWPMLQAGSSTVLSVLPLLLVDSYMVRVFVKTILLVIGLGLIHGILFLPILLLTVTSSSSSPTVDNNSTSIVHVVHNSTSIVHVPPKQNNVESPRPNRTHA